MMPMTPQAHAVVAVAPYKVEFRAVDVPPLGREDVSVRVQHSWISNGTEGSFVRGERIAGDTPRTDSDPMPFPHVPGYQKVGVVEEVGADVTSLAKGDRVFVTVSGVCDMFYSFAGHISPAVTHCSQVWKLPPEVEPVAASGLVLTQVGYNVGMRAALQPGDAAVVLGDGMVGHWAAQTLQHRGARVLLAGKHDHRLSLFRLRDGDRTVNIGRDDLLETVRSWSSDGVQVIADTVGAITALESLYPAARHGAHLVSAGFCGLKGGIDIQKMRDRELTLHTPAGWNQTRMDTTLELLRRGVITTTHLITHRFPVAEAATAFDLILTRREPVLGVVLDWGEYGV
jgi:2-desacetyl-2-hydroxyethyl bacteriochlorophyllide A dehydrogenase